MISGTCTQVSYKCSECDYSNLYKSHVVYHYVSTHCIEKRVFFRGLEFIKFYSAKKCQFWYENKQLQCVRSFRDIEYSDSWLILYTTGDLADIDSFDPENCYTNLWSLKTFSAWVRSRIAEITESVKSVEDFLDNIDDNLSLIGGK